MGILADYQKITRVLPGLPFGSGVDGPYSSATIPSLTKDSCSGAASSPTLSTAGSIFANGDILLIHQTRGAGAGQWEINKVISGGGTATLTLLKALQFTYTDSGDSQAQAIKIPQYTDVTIPSGTWSVPAWNHNVGGIFVIAARGAVTLASTIDANSIGFFGGAGGTGQDSYSGEGSNAASAARVDNTEGSGGGRRGSGGGNGTAGGDANSTGGIAVGSADLTTMLLGGGGGGGFSANETNGNGGSGGGMIIIFGKSISITTGSINLNAMNGGGGCVGQGGGGGAGGSCLIVCQSAALGSNLITASAGSGGVGSEGSGANGGVGRIAVHHSGNVTGLTSPTFADISDPSLVESGGAGAIGIL